MKALNLLSLLAVLLFCACSNDDDMATNPFEAILPHTQVTVENGSYTITPPTIQADEFNRIFTTGGWREQEIYDVFPDGSQGTNILSDLDGYSKFTFAVKEGRIKEYLAYDAYPGRFEYALTDYSYDSSNNRLTIGQQQYTVISISESEMRCTGNVFHAPWAPEAIFGLYVFSHKPEEYVRAWDEQFTERIVSNVQ